MQRCDKTLNCGESPDDARFCIDCGATLGVTGPTVVLQRPVGRPVRDHSIGLSLQTATAGTPTKLSTPLGFQPANAYRKVCAAVVVLGFLISFASFQTLEGAVYHPHMSFLMGAVACWRFSHWLKVKRPIQFLLLLGGALGLVGWLLHVLLLVVL